MNRRHTRADYLAVIERVRRARADIAFSSTSSSGSPA
jgi:tRNA A37 methylthiotransferase MiaB